MSYTTALKPQHVTLGMDNANCIRAIEEWLHRGAPVEIRVCKAKTEGCAALFAT